MMVKHVKVYERPLLEVLLVELESGIAYSATHGDSGIDDPTNGGDWGDY